MTVSNTLFEKHFQPANSVPVTLPLGFQVFDSTEIKAFFDGTPVTEGFTVDTDANTVTFTSNPGFDSSKTLILRRVCQQTQGTNLVNNQALDVEAVETALDKATALSQQGMTIDDDGELDASKLVDTTVTPRRITNVADGVAASDAATVGQLVGGTGTFVNSIVGDGGTLLTGSVTLDTDDVDEGSSNLYHTTARAAAAAPVQTITSTGKTITVTQPSTGTFNVEVVSQNTGGTVPEASGDDKFIVTSSGAYVLESGATARSSLGVGSSDNVSFNNVAAGGTLNVTGTSTLAGAVTANGGITSTGQIAAEQITSTDDLTVAADATIGATLAVTGTTTLTGSLVGASSNKVGINITSANADGMLHVQEASAGSVTAPGTGNLLVLETNDTSNGLSIIQPDPSGSDVTANIFFGKVADNDSGGITYTHNQTNRNQDTLALNFGGLSAVFDANGGSNNQELILPSTTKIKNVTTPTADSDAANKSYVDNLLPTTSSYPVAVFHSAVEDTKAYKAYAMGDNGGGFEYRFTTLSLSAARSTSGTSDIVRAGNGITLAANGVYRVSVHGKTRNTDEGTTFGFFPGIPFFGLTTDERTAAGTGTLISEGVRRTTNRLADALATGGDELAVPGYDNTEASFSFYPFDQMLTDIYTVGGSNLTFYPTIIAPCAPNQLGIVVDAIATISVERLDALR